MTRTRRSLFLCRLFSFAFIADVEIRLFRCDRARPFRRAIVDFTTGDKYARQRRVHERVHEHT